MTKSQFLQTMKTALEERCLPDAAEILEEYEQHFETRQIEMRPNRYVCQTGFSLNGTTPYENGLREGYLWDRDTDTFFLQNGRDEVGYVRCVRDLQ